MPEGACNKCGEHKELVLADCVCRDCSDRLDKQWSESTAIDWVLIRPAEKIEQIMSDLKESLRSGSTLAHDDAADAQPSFARCIFRNTTYADMKSRWAKRDAVGSTYLGGAALDELSQIRSMFGTSPKQLDSFIRPASYEEIADHDAHHQHLAEQAASPVARVKDQQDQSVLTRILWFVCVLLAAGVSTKSYNEADSMGWISHTENSVITAQANWFVGESKMCYSYPLPRSLPEPPLKAGNAVYQINCDNGPEHQMKIKFYGRVEQPEYSAVQWRCSRSESGFTCFELSGVTSVAPAP
jgi:hypothetical protein